MITSTLNALRTYMRGDGAVLLPEIELVLFAVGILVMDSWATQKERYWSSALALAGVVFSGLTLWMLRARILLNGDLSGFHETVIIDSYFLFFATLLLAATLLVILLSVHAPVAAVVRRAGGGFLQPDGCALSVRKAGFDYWGDAFRWHGKLQRHRFPQHAV